MILVRLKGGLGNQMFQYALGKVLANKNNTELKIDTSLLGGDANNSELVIRHFDLDIFKITGVLCSEEEKEFYNPSSISLLQRLINRIKKPFVEPNVVIQESIPYEGSVLNIPRFDPKVLGLKDNKCIVGSWQSEQYFKGFESIIKEEFTFKYELKQECLELAQQIRSTNSVCINVRRADYVSHPVYSKLLGTIDPDYYYTALDNLAQKEEDLNLFVFSDDIKWCEANLKFKYPTTFVNHDYAGEKFRDYLQLMSRCKHFIIPNSTFAWWAAWLCEFKGKKIYAPKLWFKDITIDSSDIVPEKWLRV